MIENNNELTNSTLNLVAQTLFLGGSFAANISSDLTKRTSIQAAFFTLSALYSAYNLKKGKNQYKSVIFIGLHLIAYGVGVLWIQESNSQTTHLGKPSLISGPVLITLGSLFLRYRSSCRQTQNSNLQG